MRSASVLRRALCGLAVLAAALLAGACRTLPDLRLVPPVQDTELRAEGGPAEARTVLAWRGLDDEDGAPRFRFRLRLENAGDTPFTLVPAEFELLDATLATIARAALEEGPPTVLPGAIAVYELVFPLPDAEALAPFDLDTLTVQSRLSAGRWSWSTTFQRAETVAVPPDPSWWPSWHFSVGVWHP